MTIAASRLAPLELPRSTMPDSLHRWEVDAVVPNRHSPNLVRGTSSKKTPQMHRPVFRPRMSPPVGSVVSGSAPR